MQASTVTSHLRRALAVREWRWWQLPLTMRLYVAAIPVCALAVIGVAAANTDWRVADLEKFFLLVCCGAISVASTPRIMYAVPGVTRDFTTMWVLPAAILLPPVYAAVIALLMVAILQIFVHRGVLHRMVFTAASVCISYAAASVVFRWLPNSIAGGAVGTGFHAFTWSIGVAACYVLGGRLQHFMVVVAVKLSDPKVRVWKMEWNREALQELFVEIDLGVLITLAVGVSPALVLIALPTVLLVRRFLVHPLLMAQSRIDSKTGLLNVSTWESEAESELSRAVRNRNALGIVLVDIDHFKLVNDTYGHLVGDRVLKAIAEALTGQSRDYDKVGRFGGEEFVLLLAQTTEHDACKIAERLRGYIANLAIPIDDRPEAPTLRITISVGVTAMGRGDSFELTDLLAASDSAMYAAKQAGRNQVAYAAPLRDMGLDAWSSTQDAGPIPGDGEAGAKSAGIPLGSNPLSSHQVVMVESEQSAASLCPQR
jgi:diguanylate cyclase (GGDEF)-like protein